MAGILLLRNIRKICGPLVVPIPQQLVLPIATSFRTQWYRESNDPTQHYKSTIRSQRSPSETFHTPLGDRGDLLLKIWDPQCEPQHPPHRSESESY